MTGFGRTGRWFGLDHWGVRPDILVAAKGATSGYWPFGFVAASGAIHDAVTGRRRVRPRLHLLAHAGRRGRRRARSSGSSRRRTWSRRARQGRAAAGPAPRAARRPSERRRDPRPGPAGRAGARRRPRDARAVPARGPPDGARRPRGRARRASSSTRAPASRTATNGDAILLGPPFVVTDDGARADRRRSSARRSRRRRRRPPTRDGPLPALAATRRPGRRSRIPIATSRSGQAMPASVRLERSPSRR